MKTHAQYICVLSLAAIAICANKAYASYDRGMCPTEVERCESRCDRHLKHWDIQKQSEYCSYKFSRCQNRRSLSTCMDRLTKCVARAIEKRDKVNDKYNQCMESCHAVPMDEDEHHHHGWHKHHKHCKYGKYGKRRGKHKHGKYHKKHCYKTCKRQAYRCQKSCRYEQRVCEREAKQLRREWFESLQSQLDFCNAMFPGDEADLDICIQGLIEGVAQPEKTRRSCYVDSYSCSAQCVIDSGKCLDEC